MEVLFTCTAIKPKGPAAVEVHRSYLGIEAESVCTDAECRIVKARFSMMRYLVFSVALICGLPSLLLAGGDYFGTWQPYSDPDLWYGPMTIREDRILYETGAKAALAPVHGDGSVFRLIDPQGVVFEDCGSKPAMYIGFHVLANGMLAVLHYQGDTPPPEPVGSDALQVIKNGACSVAFFTR